MRKKNRDEMRIRSRALSLCFVRAISVILEFLLFSIFYLVFVVCRMCCDLTPHLIFTLAAFPFCLRGLRAPALCSACLARCFSVPFRLKGKPGRDPHSAVMQHRQISRQTLIALQNYPDCLHAFAIFSLVEAVQG